jgi:hypothetical protein
MHETVLVLRACSCKEHSARIIRIFISSCHVWCNLAFDHNIPEVLGLTRVSGATSATVAW